MSENCNSDCSSCGENCPSRKEGAPSLKVAANEFSHVKKVIAVASGKGGVGKSLVTGLSAVAMRRAGCNTAILDADITGPSIPKEFNLHERAMGTEQGILPSLTASGIKVMSLNLLLEHETDPVVWRGPILADMVKQFWTDVLWEDVDYMFVDMPPGTGDVPLTVFQSLPIDGILIVTSPQDLVSVIVEKAVNMANMMNIPILGVVENMSYFECPDCGKKHLIYGESHIDAVAESNRIDTVIKLPIRSEFASLVDQGRIEEIYEPAFDTLVEKLKTI